MMHAMTSLCSILLMSSQFVAILALNASWSPSVNPVTLVTVDVCGGCQNGGLCNVAVGKCACDKGFGGDHCQFSTKNMKSKPSYHCKTDGGCKNEGICVDTGECLCIRPFHGDQCEFVDDWWNASVDEEKDKRSMIVSASFAVVVMFVVCFLIIYVNIKRVKEARQDAMEIRNATQVDGPPHLRISRRLLQNRHDDIESDDHNSSEENVTPTEGCFLPGIGHFPGVVVVAV
uniref:Multiple epidermal growth factor-like domains protein 10-like n=1 Tax=Saccoglossus kowalevskii TaxID=10224 RepID=A0ABM0MJU5_SACKO|nr:PREDICTED: multiple epidermal growth factor-like domains protein 10-like [Saccoglossus kowalevskii]